MVTAKEMAFDCAVWKYPDEEHNIEISYYKFTSEKFDVFCEQLCSEYLANLIADKKCTIADRITDDLLPDWGQKGGE